MPTPPNSLTSHFELMDECASTQDEAVALWRARKDPHAIQWVRARHQSQGRGRLGRTWESQGENLYMSAAFAWPPELGIAPTWIPLLAGAVLCRAVRELQPSQPVFLKWPNDLVTTPKGEADKLSKLGGILVEGKAASLLVAGWGVNVAAAPTQVPHAAALAPLLLEGLGADSLAARLRASFETALARLIQDPGETDFLRAWLAQEGMAPLWGRWGHTEDGRRCEARGLGPAGELKARFEDGSEKLLRSGEWFYWPK